MCTREDKNIKQQQKKYHNNHHLKCLYSMFANDYICVDCNLVYIILTVGFVQITYLLEYLCS
jgi:hypothetical protein